MTNANATRTTNHEGTMANTSKTKRITTPAVSAALAKLREDESCDETFATMLAAVYVAAKALRDVPEARISLGCGLSEEQVEAFADALEVKVARQVTLLGMGLDADGPRIIYSFHGRYEAALTGGKYTVEIGGQGSRTATLAEVQEHGVRKHDDVVVLKGDEAAALVKGGQS